MQVLTQVFFFCILVAVGILYGNLDESRLYMEKLYDSNFLSEWKRLRFLFSLILEGRIQMPITPGPVFWTWLNPQVAMVSGQFQSSFRAVSEQF